MTSRRSFWSYFIFIMILCSWFPSIPARADLEPDVYTGILEHDLTGMVQLARMFVLKSNDAVTGQPVVHAQLTLFFSDFKSVEYVPVYYSDVIYDASKGGLTLQDHGNTYPVRRFPTVVLKRSGDVLQGPYISPELGKIGNMILRKGWTVFQEDILARPILSNVGGFYQGNCTSTDLSSHQVTGIEVLPTRLTSGDYPIVTASDSTMKFMNYATSEYCNYTTPYTTCDFYQRGHFDSYRDNLLLSMGADGLLCKHDGENILSCGTTLEPTCRFTKAPTQTLGAPPLYDEVPALTARTGPEKDPNLSCDDWNGSFAGILKHRVNGLKQNIHLDITTYIANDAGNTPRCYLMASVKNLDLILEDYQ